MHLHKLVMAEEFISKMSEETKDFELHFMQRLPFNRHVIVAKSSGS
jgi:hypothetical protein